MRRSIAIISLTGSLLFGAAGVANATVAHDAIPASTTTISAQQEYDQNKSDKTGLWGLVGLLGLGGLAGLVRRRETHPGAGPGVGPAGTGRGTTPRA